MNIKTDKVGIIGSGSWATALAKMVLENVSQINWFFRRKETIESFKELNANPRYLQSVEFDLGRIHFYNNVNDLLNDSDIIVLAVPSAFLPDVLKRSKKYLSKKLSCRESRELYRKRTCLLLNT
jgi:glycerol-3-phosphate dehydrogenase (NAD(P)+)